MSNELENTLLDQHGANHPQENHIQESASQEQPKQDSKGDQNWRLMRDRAENAERRNQELERMIQQNMNQNKPSQRIQLLEDDEDDIDISDDSLIEGKQLKKYVKTLKRENQATRKQLEEMVQRTVVEQAEFKLKMKYPDFDNVVTKDNLDKLAMAKPALYRSILANQDLSDRGDTAYVMIKAEGISSEPTYDEYDRKLEENRSKPRAAANVAPQSSDTPLTRVGDYDRRIITEDRRKQILRQVEEAKRNRS